MARSRRYVARIRAGRWTCRAGALRNRHCSGSRGRLGSAAELRPVGAEAQTRRNGAGVPRCHGDWRCGNGRRRDRRRARRIRTHVIDLRLAPAAATPTASPGSREEWPAPHPGVWRTATRRRRTVRSAHSARCQGIQTRTPLPQRGAERFGAGGTGVHHRGSHQAVPGGSARRAPGGYRNGR